MVLIHHHIKYKEIHGIDEVVLMEKSEHAKLHARLRKEKKCNVPPEKLHAISMRARSRADYDNAKDRARKQYTKYGEEKIIKMRIYNSHNNKRFFVYTRLRPDIISSAMTPALRTGRA
jgi:hypothetical protein